MVNTKKKIENLLSKDIFLLGIFWVMLLLFVTFGKDNYYHLHLYELVISINKIAYLFTINYILLPKLYSQGRPVSFIAALVLGAFFFGGIEEFFIEPYLDNDVSSHPVAPPLSILFSYGTTALIFLGIKQIIQVQKKQRLIDQLEREKSESQLKFLKSQINPHILFNNLNNIYSLTIHNDHRTSSSVLKLSNLMRYVIYESSEDYVLLSKELKYLEDYLELQKIQLEGRGNVKYKVLGNPAGYTIAPLLLLPFIENSFKHSMDTQIDNISIDLKVEINENTLIFKSVNSYVSSANNASISPNGIGLNNTKQRLSLLYPNNHVLTIRSEADLFTVQLTINLVQ
ncbi:sensor histidine kinase [Ulvibacterium marinum]|uniref:sensor histidine kinase n=1 Tax=Ulvibacterium marinum TaxID=2419782 RepID=UPI0024948981|nr:histidine kinase [Ulvibacterium marinum]